MSDALDRVLEALDVGLQAPPEVPVGDLHVADYDDELCVRCRDQGRTDGELCGDCRAWLLEDSDVDPLMSDPLMNDDWLDTQLPGLARHIRNIHQSRSRGVPPLPVSPVPPVPPVPLPPIPTVPVPPPLSPYPSLCPCPLHALR